MEPRVGPGPARAGRAGHPARRAAGDEHASGAEGRRGGTCSRTRCGHAHARGTFGTCVKNAGIGGVCAWAVWGAAHHVAEMPHDGLFYVACFGIAVFGAIGLGCLWSAANYLRGA